MPKVPWATHLRRHIGRLIGRYYDPREPAAPSAAVRELILSTTALFPSTAWDHHNLERLGAAMMAASRECGMAAAGWQRRRWDRYGPDTERYPGNAWAIHGHPGYLDHPYRLKPPEGPAWYVGEPYQLEADAILHLADLIRQGWSVTVRADRALHFPGHTLSVWVRRQAQAQNPHGYPPYA
jgi:hypothetical protein